MEYSPPPLFKQGASARVKMIVFALLSVGLLLVDSRMHSLSALRQVVGTVLYPLQMAALTPRNLIYGAGDYFSSLSTLEQQVRDLKRQQIATAQTLQQAQLSVMENGHLRQLMDARQHLPVKSMLAEILYDTRDVNARKIVLDRGTQQGMSLGLPVIDNLGVVGQVTRVFPFTSEVTLLTDKEQAIPVQVLRNGLRSVAYGRDKTGQLELRFVEPSADIVVGDVLITSGLDGVYPAGLAVSRVTRVENSAASGAFGTVLSQPLAGIGRNTQLLVLLPGPEMPPRPPDEEVRAPKKHVGKMGPIKENEPAKETAPAARDGAAPAAATPATAPAAATPGAPAAAAPAPAKPKEAQ